MERRFTAVLERWEKSREQKPLLVIGARQVGKTWIIKGFCEKNYKDYVYINLEKTPVLQSVFEDSLDSKDILRKLGIMIERNLDENTALFIDEIQVCESAITSLKYFCEADENYRVIGAGSLLGVKLSRFESSFPVGKVQIEHLYPMSFVEFLTAVTDPRIIDEIRTAYSDKKALPDAIHHKALQFYHDYLMVGGMPGAVAKYKDTNRDISGLDTEFYNSLRLSYLADMTKYTISAAEGVKITEVYDSIPRQLGKDNPKFKYNEIRPSASKRDFSSSLDWLVASGMVIRVDKLGSPHVPMKAYIEKGFDRIYLSDVGLLSFICGLKPRDLISEQDNIYKGAVVENYVIQEALFYGETLCYFKPSDSMEIDLILDSEDGICPIEIKSGRNKRSTSLKNYIAKYNPTESFRISERNIGDTGDIISVPLYAAFCLFEKM